MAHAEDIAAVDGVRLETDEQCEMERGFPYQDDRERCENEATILVVIDALGDEGFDPLNSWCCLSCFRHLADPILECEQCRYRDGDHAFFDTEAGCMQCPECESGDYHRLEPRDPSDHLAIATDGGIEIPDDHPLSGHEHLLDTHEGHLEAMSRVLADADPDEYESAMLVLNREETADTIPTFASTTDQERQYWMGLAAHLGHVAQAMDASPVDVAKHSVHVLHDIHSDHGPVVTDGGQQRRASTPRIGPDPHPGTAKPDPQDDCPACGEPIDGSVTKHLRDDCEEWGGAYRD